MTTGLHPKLSMAEYLAASGINSHAIKLFNQSPAHLKDFMDGKLEPEETEPMLFGRTLHALVFENLREYVVQPETYSDGKKWHNGATYCKEWNAEQVLPIIDSADERLLNSSLAAIRACPLAMKLLEAGQPEVSMFVDDPVTGLQIKCRADWLRTKGIVDLKSTLDASTAGFGREIFKRGYHIQAAINLRCAELLGIDAPNFHFIALEKGVIPRVNVRLLKQDAIMLGKIELNRCLKEIAECMETGVWPGYCDGEIELIDLPAFAYSTASMELEIGGEKVEI